MANNAPLALHSKGQDVSAVQEQLKKAGIPVPEKEEAEQSYAAGTQSAVQAFQPKAGLSVTGIVDEVTSTALAV